MEKSELTPVEQVAFMEDLSLVLSCKVEVLLTSYFGLPLRASYKSARVCNVVEKKLRRRLALWKRQYLSKGGRLTLIKNTLSSFFIYFMSSFIIPKRVFCRTTLYGYLQLNRWVMVFMFSSLRTGTRDKIHNNKIKENKI